MAEQEGSRIGGLIGAVVVGILTAGSAPWWWPKDTKPQPPADPSGTVSRTISTSTMIPPSPPADGVIYRARLGDGDHCNGNGVRLETAAQIVRQDRANYHRYRHADAEDAPDTLSAADSARKELEAALVIDPQTARAIVATTPLIAVSTGAGSTYNVAIVQPGAPAAGCP